LEYSKVVEKKLAVFEGKKIRRVWDEKNENVTERHVLVVDVCITV